MNLVLRDPSAPAQLEAVVNSRGREVMPDWFGHSLWDGSVLALWGYSKEQDCPCPVGGTVIWMRKGSEWKVCTQ